MLHSDRIIIFILSKMCLPLVMLFLYLTTTVAQSGPTTVHFYFNLSGLGVSTTRNLTCKYDTFIRITELSYQRQYYSHDSTTRLENCDVTCLESVRNRGYYDASNSACKNYNLLRLNCMGRSTCSMEGLMLQSPLCLNVASKAFLIGVSYICTSPDKHINLCEKSSRTLSSDVNNPIYVTSPVETRPSTCTCSIRVMTEDRFDLILLDYWQILDQELLKVQLLDVGSTPHTFSSTGPNLLGKQFPYTNRKTGVNLTLSTKNYIALGKSSVQLRLAPSYQTSDIEYRVTCNGGNSLSLLTSTLPVSPNAKESGRDGDSNSPHKDQVTIIVLSVCLTVIVALIAAGIAFFLWRRRSKPTRRYVQYVKGESIISNNKSSSQVSTLKKPLVIEHTVKLRNEMTSPLSPEKEAMLEPGNYHTLEANSASSEPMYNEIDNNCYRYLCDASEPDLPMKNHDNSAPPRVRRSVPYQITDIVGRDHCHLSPQPGSTDVPEFTESTQDDDETNVTPEGIYSDPIDVGRDWSGV